MGPFFSGTPCIFPFVKIRTLQPSMKKSNLGTNYAFSNSLLTPLFAFVGQNVPLLFSRQFYNNVGCIQEIHLQ